ncbi:YjfB family protein [Chitinimonas sp.]|uniref:YjfB family protein n=1 Tax=Chitinimonas sp. TaxID=1934313 RepID=UPI002F9593E3
MDISSMASAISDQAAAKTQASAAILTLRKAMDIQAQNAATLLEALPTPPSNPAHLGNSVDVRA